MKTTPPAYPGQTINRMQRFEKKIHAVQHAAAQLPGEDFYAEILGSIQRPDWTAVADGLFVEALVDTIHARLHELAELHKRLSDAAKVEAPTRARSFSFAALSGPDVLQSAAQ